MTTGTTVIEGSIRRSIAVKEALLSRAGVIEAMAGKMVETLRRGGKILFFGNGGSAADAQHLAAELVGRFSRDRRALAAIALTTDTSILTAVANDYSYAAIFTRQLQALLREGDLVVAISTSGNSSNVLDALAYAREMGVTALGLTGEDGGKMRSLVDLCLQVPATDTSRIQEAHIMVGHILCELVDRDFARELN